MPKNSMILGKKFLRNHLPKWALNKTKGKFYRSICFLTVALGTFAKVKKIMTATGPRTRVQDLKRVAKEN